jgi:phage tail P2-like protein
MILENIPDWKWRSLVPNGLQGSPKAEIFIQFLFLFEQNPDLRSLIWQRWDEVDRTVLPYLIQYFALDNLVDWASLGEEGVRGLLKEAIEWHRHRGTPYALHKYLDLIGAEGELEEWWQGAFQGEPYTAKLNLWGDEEKNQNLDFSSQDLIEKIIRAIDFAKPATRDIAVRFGYRIGNTPSVATTATPTPSIDIPGQQHFTNPLGQAGIISTTTPTYIAEIPQDSPSYKISAKIFPVEIISPLVYLDV